LTYTRTAAPFHGTLDGIFRNYLGLVGITSGILIDADLDLVPVVAPGWTGVVLDAIKRLCAAHHVEISLVSNNVVVRKVRERGATNRRDASVTTAVDDTSLAQAVEVFYLRSATRSASALIYPAAGWSEDDRIISVGAGEVEEVEIDLGVDSGSTGVGVSVE